MSDLIRMIGMKVSNKGACNKCGNSVESGYHANCNRWPVRYGLGKGFHYTGNSRETTLADLKKIVTVICAGDVDETPVRFEIKIMQTRNVDEAALPDSETE